MFNEMYDSREAFDEVDEARYYAEAEADGAFEREDMDADWDDTFDDPMDFEDDGQPSEYDEWQDLYGGDDWDHGQYEDMGDWGYDGDY